MAFIVRQATNIRNNWKKSIFFTGVALYGGKWLKTKHEDNLLRRKYCDEARQYGAEKIGLGEIPRRVTVFLNPAASGGKARKIFDKTAAPILYVAGIEVNVVSTEYEGQVKGFMSVLDPSDTDGVVVAGGDGTLLEAVTGFLRKEDKTFADNIPVGVIPLGETNRFARLMYGEDLDQVKLIAEAAIAVVRSVTKKVDVIKLDGGEGKTIYALTGLEIGAYRDAEDRKTKYWYFGPLKHRWTYIRTAMKDWPPVFKAKLTYLEASEDNMVEEELVIPQKPVWSFYNFLFRKTQEHKKKLEAEFNAKMEAKRLVEEAGMVSTDISTVELTVSSSALLNADAPLNSIQLNLGPSDPDKTQLIQEGWKRIKQTDFNLGSEKDSTMLVKKMRLEPEPEDLGEGIPRWFNIDGEAFEAMPVDISLLRNKLNFYSPRPQHSPS